MARIRAALRRPTAAPDRCELIVAGDLSIDTARRRVFVQKKELALTPTEFELLAVLARNADRVLTHRQLLATVWGSEHLEQIQYLRVYTKLLRQKLEQDPARPRRIVTVLGIGYRLVTNEAN